MMSFKKFALYREVSDKIAVIATMYAEQADTQALENAKKTLLGSFEQEFNKDPGAALTWLSNLYTKALPADYKNYYTRYQQTQKGATPQGQTQQNQNTQAQGQNQQQQ